MIRRLTLRALVLLCVGAGVLLSGRPAHAQIVSTVIQNRYIAVAVSSLDGTFAVVNNDGDPLDTRDNFFQIVGNDGSLFFETATLYISSATSAVGADTVQIGSVLGTVERAPFITPDGRTIQFEWRFGGPGDAEGRNVLVIQRISLVRDLARVEYELRNEGQPKVLGVRLAVDVSDSAVLNDTLSEALPGSLFHDAQSNPVFVPRIGMIRNETDFRNGIPAGIDQRLTPITTPVPKEWYTYAPAFAPF